MVCSIIPPLCGRRKTVYSRLCMVSLAIGTTAGLFRNHIIRRLEVHRVHFARLHEFQNLHRLRGLGLDLLDLLGIDDDVFVFPVLVALDDIATLEDLVVRRTNELLFYPMVVSAVKLVERDAAAARARE